MLIYNVCSLGRSAADLVELVNALALAWKNLAAYPPGHPAVVASVEAAHRRLAELIAHTGRVVLGISRDGLIYGDQKLETPHARRLAQTLHRREVVVLSFEPGIEAAELQSLLRLLGGGDGSAEGRPPLADGLQAAGVRHIHLESLDYSVLQATDALERPPAADQLWDDILRAVLTGVQLSPEGRRLLSPGETHSAAEIASLLEKLPQVVAAAGGEGPAPALPARVGEAVAGSLRRLTGPARLAAVPQIADLARAVPRVLRESILASVIRTLALEQDGGEALQAFSSSFSPDAVLPALRQLEGEGAKLSSHALRVLQALSAASKPAPAPPAAPPEAASSSLVAELSALFREEDIDRFNPEDHQALLETISIELPPPRAPAPEAPPGLDDRLDTLADEALTERLVPTLLELLGRQGPRESFELLLARLESIFRLLVTGARLEPAIGLVEGVRELGADSRFPPQFQAEAQQSLARMATGESAAAFIDSLQQPSARATGLARRLVDLLGAAATRSFLLALAEETNQSRRRRLLNLLAFLGPTVVPEAIRLLSDDRWFVVRNTILLLRKVGDTTSLPEVRRCANHPDLRVRLEAIKTLVAFDPNVSRELLEKAINDPDPKLAEAAVVLAGSYGITEAVGPLVAILTRWDPLGRRRPLRIKALRALGELADSAALKRLGRFFREWPFPGASLEERRAAFRSLESYPESARGPLLERGLKSRDAQIREICRSLSSHA